MYIYIYICESFCSTVEINIVNQLYFNKIKFLKNPRSSTGSFKQLALNWVIVRFTIY